MEQKPEKSLSEVTLQELSLEELAMEYDHVVDYETGKVTRVGRVDRNELRRKVIELNKKGREAMAPFVKWQSEKYGDSQTSLDYRSLAVWRMLCERPSDPVSFLLDRERYTHIERLVLRKQLTRFALFLIEEAERPEDIDYGKRLANRVMDVPATRKLRERTRKTKAVTPPLTEEQIQSVLDVIEDRTIKEGPRKPWYRPILRFVILMGQSGQYDFLACEKETWVRVVREYEAGKPAALPIWGVGNKSKLLPVHLAYEEMKTVADWSFPWGQVYNIITPAAKTESTRAAKTILSQEIKRACELANIPKTCYAYAVRNSAIKRLWETTHDYMLLQSMFGVNASTAKRMFFLDIKIPIFTR